MQINDSIFLPALLADWIWTKEEQYAHLIVNIGNETSHLLDIVISFGRTTSRWLDLHYNKVLHSPRAVDEKIGGIITVE